jgi:hypothetical protein
MRKKLTTAAILATSAAMLTTVAAAEPLTAKQRVSIQVKQGASFVLTPLTSGAIKRDAGTATFCCWSRRFVTRDGQAIEIDDPQMTLTSKRGTLVARNRLEFIDIPDGWAVFTGTWKIVRGTGDYAGLAGSGRGGGVQLANGGAKALYEGFVSS